MNNLSKANQARKEKALNKLYNFSDHGITSLKNLIDKGIIVESEKAYVPQLKYNRTKFNRMTNQAEQDEYYRKCHECTKAEYRLFFEKGSFVTCSKFVYEYFNEQKRPVYITTVYFLYWKGHFQFSTNDIEEIAEYIADDVFLDIDKYKVKSSLREDVSIKEILKDKIT